MCRLVVRSTHLHTPKLMELEKLFVLSHSLLGEEDRTGIINFNSDKNC